MDLTDKYPIQTSCFTNGINLEGVCINKKCIYYNREIIKSLGFGIFNLNDILHSIKCGTCPYKEYGTNPAIIIKQILLKDCQWKISGSVLIRAGIEIPKQWEKWNFIKGEDSNKLHCKIDQNLWTKIFIHIKPFKDSNFNY